MKYKTILVDPPWEMDFVRLKMRPNQVTMPYPTMSLTEICTLGIDLRPHVAASCNLFLWATHTHLPAAFKVMSEWGFKYHCCITWDKKNGRPCWGFKRVTEFLLYGYRGKITVNQRGKFILTLISEKLTTHSTKPTILYDILETNAPEPRLELFARHKREGWDSIGFDIAGCDIRESLGKLATL